MFDIIIGILKFLECYRIGCWSQYDKSKNKKESDQSKEDVISLLFLFYIEFLYFSCTYHGRSIAFFNEKIPIRFGICVLLSVFDNTRFLYIRSSDALYFSINRVVSASTCFSSFSNRWIESLWMCIFFVFLFFCIEEK